ncbi:hypothetical protein EUGRSUZ_H00737 [Eucalyptus grandis]|uniref:Uncharacterized protein n=2 Tax=Eucalyptus grandis TaxID=71139 RepID=A0ACC3JMN9_EUCGR|nr:hypothetical protein EUGRSUZ_H00737 [Eucalyptus grandis]
MASSPSPQPLLRRLPAAVPLLLLLLLAPAADALVCSSQKFSNNVLYSTCLDLPTLSASLHFSYDDANSSAAVAFVAAPPKGEDGWVSWALNPTATGMFGAQALIAFRDAGAMTVKTYNITSTTVRESPISFETWERTAEYNSADGTMRIFAKIKVPAGDPAKLNQVWQVGSSVTNGVPDPHAMAGANLGAKGTLDLVTGTTTAGGGGSGIKKKNIHGILNAVSWGIMFPIGAIIARYVRAFPSADPAWFYLHAFCQTSAYAIGVAGWGTGLKLGSQSTGIQYTGHRNIGIALFALATVQIFALFLRPKKDHKYRFYWNIYHHGLGYTILILGILNVFKGLDILQPDNKWKSAYIILISVLGGVAVVLELITWIVVLKRKKSGEPTKPYDGYNNGQGRQQPLAI